MILFRKVHRKLDLIVEMLTGLTGAQGGGSSAQLTALTAEITKMAGELEGLTAQVAANTDVEASAATLLGGLKAALDAAIAAGNPAALTALSASLGTSAAALSAAVAANTPTAPAA